MHLKRRLLTGLMMRFGMPRIKRVIELERTTSTLPGRIRSTETAPERFDIPLEMMNLIASRNDLSMQFAVPVTRMQSLLKNKRYAIESLSKNPDPPRRVMTEEFRQEMENFAKSLGIGSIGYVKLSHHLIFRDVGVLYTNAIVLTMEMDKEKIEHAPSAQTANMIMQTYDKLGIATNKIADFLRENGYAAQASHPLGGLVLYPPLAQKAGLGWVGHHGLLITPEFGPRVRLSAIFTSIENLPFSEKNKHQWIENYCEKCGRCVRSCPPKAILEKPQSQGNRVTHIDRNRCFPYFIQHYACTICVKVCPFSRLSYSKIHKRMMSKD